MDAGNSVCTDLSFSDDMFYGSLCYGILVFILSMAIRVLECFLIVCDRIII